MIPVTVVGGYLGAGKTTLVNHLLRHAHGVRLAILVNDFGELPIDADLIEARDDEMIAIAGGCVCCSFGSDLMAALAKLAARPIDHIVIETSGVALPGVVARSVALVPGFARDGVVVLADAETVMDRAADRYMSDTIERQLADADLVIVNKTDLLPVDRLATMHDWLATKTGDARLIDAVRGAVPFEIVIGSCTTDAHADDDTNGWRDDASARYEARVFPILGPVDAAALGKALTRRELGVLRAKGSAMDGDASAISIQTVGGRFEITPARDGRVRRDAIVCIGLKGQVAIAGIEAVIRSARTSP